MTFAFLALVVHQGMATKQNECLRVVLPNQEEGRLGCLNLPRD